MPFEPTSSKTITDMQTEIEKALEHLSQRRELPDDLRPLLSLAPPKSGKVHVSLRKKDRQIKKTASAQNWSPESGTVSISFETAETGGPSRKGVWKLGLIPELEAQEASGLRRAGGPLERLVSALQRAEKDLHFVALKWFRDKCLPQAGFAPQDDRQSLIVQAIDRGWVFTGKVNNPRTPQFPVTTIRLNRSHPEVRRMLVEEAAESAPDFRPVDIPGERLSQTILGERR